MNKKHIFYVMICIMAFCMGTDRCLLHNRQDNQHKRVVSSSRKHMLAPIALCEAKGMPTPPFGQDFALFYPEDPYAQELTFQVYSGSISSESQQVLEVITGFLRDSMMLFFREGKITYTGYSSEDIGSIKEQIRELQKECWDQLRGHTLSSSLLWKEISADVFSADQFVHLLTSGLPRYCAEYGILVSFTFFPITDDQQIVRMRIPILQFWEVKEIQPLRIKEHYGQKLTAQKLYMGNNIKIEPGEPEQDYWSCVHRSRSVWAMAYGNVVAGPEGIEKSFYDIMHGNPFYSQVFQVGAIMGIPFIWKWFLENGIDPEYLKSKGVTMPHDVIQANENILIANEFFLYFLSMYRQLGQAQIRADIEEELEAHEIGHALFHRTAFWRDWNPQLLAHPLKEEEYYAIMRYKQYIDEMAAYLHSFSQSAPMVFLSTLITALLKQVEISKEGRVHGKTCSHLWERLVDYALQYASPQFFLFDKALPYPFRTQIEIQIVRLAYEEALRKAIIADLNIDFQEMVSVIQQSQFRATPSFLDIKAHHCLGVGA